MAATLKLVVKKLPKLLFSLLSFLFKSVFNLLLRRLDIEISNTELVRRVCQTHHAEALKILLKSFEAHLK